MLFLVASITLFLFGGMNVSADSPNIYYFSDTPNCHNVVNLLINNTPLTINDICLVEMQPDADEYMNYDIYNYLDLEDKIIIFEVAKGFSYEIDYGTGDTFPQKLEFVFSYWKENDCQIMFISGTDETKYLDYNDFLDYVDFHIILDVKHVFMMNVFYYVEQRFGTIPQNFDLLFDNLFVENLFGNINGNTILKHDYIIPYIRSRYRNDILNGYTNADALTNNGANIYLPLGGLTSIYNITENPNYYSYDLSYFYFNNADPFVVSASGNNYFGGQYDYEIMLNYYDSYCVHSLFFYDIHGVDADLYINNGFTNVYQCSPYASTNKIVEMITSFIFDNYSIWSQYDNWAGRCDVTHLMTVTGETGWMHNFTGDSDDFVNCWSIIISDGQDYNLYFDDGTLS